MKRILIYIFVCLLAVSCKKNESSPESWKDYYPLGIGTCRTYECTEIRIDVPTGINDTLVYLLRETVVDIVADTNSCVVFAVNTERKDKNSEKWVPAASQSVWRYAHSFVRTGNNLPCVVLKFPARDLFSWDYNEFNVNDAQNVYYSEVNQQCAVGGKTYDSVLTVSQQNFKSLFTYQFAEERYAKNIGMISRQHIDVESQPNHALIDISEPIENRITKGTITTCELVGFSIK